MHVCARFHRRFCFTTPTTAVKQKLCEVPHEWQQPACWGLPRSISAKLGWRWRQDLTSSIPSASSPGFLHLMWVKKLNALGLESLLWTGEAKGLCYLCPILEGTRSLAPQLMTSTLQKFSSAFSEWLVEVLHVLFPVSRQVASCWELELSHNGSTYTNNLTTSTIRVSFSWRGIHHHSDLFHRNRKNM